MPQQGSAPRKRKVAGFTLIETIAAAAILAVAIAGLTNVSAASAALHRAGVLKSAAMRAAEQQLASVASSDFATIPATWNAVGFQVGLEGKAPDGLDAPPGDADGLPGLVEIVAPNGNPAELIEIQVTVAWVSPHGPASVSRRMRLSRLGSGS